MAVQWLKIPRKGSRPDVIKHNRDSVNSETDHLKLESEEQKENKVKRSEENYRTPEAEQYTCYGSPRRWERQTDRQSEEITNETSQIWGRKWTSDLRKLKGLQLGWTQRSSHQDTLQPNCARSERVLTPARGKRFGTYRTGLWLSHLSAETSRARWQWVGIFKVLKEKAANQENSIWPNGPSKMKLRPSWINKSWGRSPPALQEFQRESLKAK